MARTLPIQGMRSPSIILKFRRNANCEITRKSCSQLNVGHICNARPETDEVPGSGGGGLNAPKEGMDEGAGQP